MDRMALDFDRNYGAARGEGDRVVRIDDNLAGRLRAGRRGCEKSKSGNGK